MLPGSREASALPNPLPAAQQGTTRHASTTARRRVIASEPPDEPAQEEPVPRLLAAPELDERLPAAPIADSPERAGRRAAQPPVGALQRCDQCRNRRLLPKAAKALGGPRGDYWIWIVKPPAKGESEIRVLHPCHCGDSQHAKRAVHLFRHVDEASARVGGVESGQRSQGSSSDMLVASSIADESHKACTVAPRAQLRHVCTVGAVFVSRSHPGLQSHLGHSRFRYSARGDARIDPRSRPWWIASAHAGGRGRRWGRRRRARRPRRAGCAARSL
jgi:hypothetical protein